MSEFKSWRSYWEFERAVKSKRRYVYHSDTKDFLNTVLATSQSRTEKIAEGSFLWRAQLGHCWRKHCQDGEYIDDVPSPFPSERMKPLADRATEGRANPKGIPCLYLATHKDTALAEVRPWIGSLVSVGQFKLLRDITVVNCTTDSRGRRIYVGNDEPSPERREESVWYDIDRAFAKPVERNDNLADYAPTQIIAELFKSESFDGIAYRSALGQGHNVALFDIETAELKSRSLSEVESVQFKHVQRLN